MVTVQQGFNSVVQAMHRFRSLERPAHLYLLAAILYGMVMRGWFLFFNFYILESGFSREFLGLANAAPYMAVLFTGLFIGVLSDRLGSKRAMILGVILASVFRGCQILLPYQPVILGAGFLAGAFHTLFFISQAPFIMRAATLENRTLLFSLSFCFNAISAAIGSLLAGYLPSLFRYSFGEFPEGAFIYRVTLLTMVGLSFLAIFPLLLIRLAPPSRHTVNTSPVSAGAWQLLRRPLTLKIASPHLLIGLGAALVIPYMNLFFVERFQVSDARLGMLFSGVSIVMAIGALLVPALARKLGGKIQAVIATQAASVVFLLIIGFSPYLWIAAVSFLFRGALMNMSMPLYDNFVMEQVDEHEQGTLNSVKETAFQMGWTIGPYISSLVQVAYGFTLLFVSTAILYTAAIFLTWFFFSPHRSHETSPEAT